MKNKYQRASKLEKKEARTNFFQTDFGKNLKKRLDRLIIYSILLIAFTIYIIIDNILKDNSIINYVTAGFLLIFALIFLIGRYYVIVKNVNSFMIKNTKKK